MTRKTMTRAGAALALMVLVAGGPTAAVAGEREGLRRERRAAALPRNGGVGLFAEVWWWLINVSGKQGSLIDPNGQKAPAPPPPEPVETTSPAPAPGS